MVNPQLHEKNEINILAEFFEYMLYNRMHLIRLK